MHRGPVSSNLPKLKPAHQNLFALALLAIMALQLVHLSRVTSITWDEGHHLFDGYNIWKRFDYRLNPEVPPLVKLVAAAPLLHAPLVVPPNQERAEQTEAFLDGRSFLVANGYDRILFPARMACMVFTLLLGLLLYLATKDLFGPIAALFALALFVFDPNLIAHGALVTTDVASSCLLLASIYAWYRYRKLPGTGRLLLVGFVIGLAVVAKFTGIFVWPMLLLLAIAEAIRERDLRLLGRRCVALIGIALIAYAILWSFYGFRYSVAPKGSGLDMHPPLAEYLPKVPKPSDAAHLAFAAKRHLLPEAYIWGLANTKVTEDVDTSYFFGHVYRHGNWMYFPAAFLIKSTLPLLFLLCLAPFAWSTWKRTNKARELTFLLLPVVVYLVIAMSSDMNIGLRHLLPIYPFLYILAAGTVVILLEHNRRWAAAFAVLLIWQIGTSLHSAPGYMGYGNEAWGGPDNVHKYLSDANTDWGQQLKDVKTYIDQHHITNCWFAYFVDGVVEPADYGIPCKRLPTTETTFWMNLPMDVPPVITGTVFLSDSDLQGIEYGQGALNPYDSFHNIKPTALIQHGLWVYDGTFNVPLASALDQTEKGVTALSANHLDAALEHARQAVALAPQSTYTQSALGDILAAQGRKAEAHTHYAAALNNARTIEPALQADQIPGLETKLAQTAR
jgi:4-amino-4-deoxy-L-arabinose transferase-like glycosyltransferase